MQITLEQARVLESVARLGTVQKAATELHRGHSAVLYAIKCLEDQTGLILFDRSAHRNRLTREGDVVLRHCERLLSTHQDLEAACIKMKTGWEPSIKLIYDEVVDFNFIGDALLSIQKMTPTTEIKVLSAHLNDVESLFVSERADLMVTVSPLHSLQIPSRRLNPLKMLLVAHRGHELVTGGGVTLEKKDLLHQTFVTIKSSTNLGFGTDGMPFESVFFVNDFSSKRSVIKKGLGFGWLPDYLIADELKNGTLRVLKTEIPSTLKLRPLLYHRSEDKMGRASTELLKLLKSNTRKRY